MLKMRKCVHTSHLSQEILDAPARGDAPRLGNIQFCWSDKQKIINADMITNLFMCLQVISLGTDCISYLLLSMKRPHVAVVHW